MPNKYICRFCGAPMIRGGFRLSGSGEHITRKQLYQCANTACRRRTVNPFLTMPEGLLSKKEVKEK